MRTRSSIAKAQELEAVFEANKVTLVVHLLNQQHLSLIDHLPQEPLSEPPKPAYPTIPTSTPCRLPPELLDQIFDLISRKQDFASLALVSRQFLHLARPRLYRRIFLDLSGHGECYYRERKPWEERIKNWFIPPVVRTLAEQPACALHVKTVEVVIRSRVIYEDRGGAEFGSFAPTPQIIFDSLKDTLCNMTNLNRIYSAYTQRFDHELHETLASLLVKYCPKLQILDLPSTTFNFASSLSLLSQLPLLKEIRSNPCTDYPLPRSTPTPTPTAKLHTLRFTRPIGNPRAFPWLLQTSFDTLHTLSIRLQDCDGIKQHKRKHTTDAQPLDLSSLTNLRHLTIHVRASSPLRATLKSALDVPISHLTLIATNIELSKVRFLHLLPRRLEHLSIGPSGFMRLLDWPPLLLPSTPCPNLKVVELAGGGNPETCSKTTFEVNSTAEVPIKYGFKVKWIIETVAMGDPWGVRNPSRSEEGRVKDGPEVHWPRGIDAYAPQRLEGWRSTNCTPALKGQEESFEQRRIRKETRGR